MEFANMGVTEEIDIIVNNSEGLKKHHKRIKIVDGKKTEVNILGE